MKRHHILAVLVLVASLATFMNYAYAAGKKDTSRLLTGKVMDGQDNPLPDSVVYLSNTRTQAIKSYIVGTNGLYHFPELSPNVDYEVYAQFNGHKSETKTLSQFESRQQVNINLRINTK